MPYIMLRRMLRNVYCSVSSNVKVRFSKIIEVNLLNKRKQGKVPVNIVGLPAAI
jgi:hypothetical protein